MHYSAYYPVDVVNGPGTRCTLFVSGCDHRCHGCHNAKTWAFNSGQEYTQELETKILKDLADTRIVRQGLSLSGGDPLHPANAPTVLGLIKKIKNQMPEKDIWCWTGYKLEELSYQQQQLLPYLDVLIDGRYEYKNATLEMSWRGSSNQNLHRLNATALQPTVETA